MVSLTREDVHRQVREMLLILSPESKFPDTEGDTTHFSDDLDLLRACVKHEMLDKEARAREAYDLGFKNGKFVGGNSGD
jgi:hypothetical protein